MKADEAINKLLKPVGQDTGLLLDSGFGLCHVLEHDDDFNGLGRVSLTRGIYTSNKKGELLKTLPCSQLKSGVPMKLFSMRGISSAGILFDAREVDILYTAPNLIYNCHTFLGINVNINNMSVFPETDAIQKTFMEEYKVLHNTHVPLGVSAQKNEEALQAMQRSWELIAGNYQDYYDKTFDIDNKDHLNPMVTETLVNLDSAKKIKAVIYHSPALDVTPCHNQNDYNGLLRAVVLKGVLARKYNHDVPVLFYKQTEGPCFDVPEVGEIVLDKKIISDAIELSGPEYRNILKKYCGSALGCDLGYQPPAVKLFPTSALASAGGVVSVNINGHSV